MKTTLQSNRKLTIQFSTAAVLLCCLATDAIPRSVAGETLSADQIAAKSRAAYAALSSYSADGKVLYEMAGQKNTLTFNARLQRPNLYRVEWTQSLGSKGVVWSAGDGDYLRSTPMGGGTDAKLEKKADMKQALSQATGLSWSAASTIAGAFFNQDLGDVFGAPVLAGRYPLQKDADAKVGDVDCYVLSCTVDLSKQPNKPKPGTAATTLWIGKEDLLVHQCRTKYVEKVDTSAQQSDAAIDEAIKKSLEAQKKPVTQEAIAAMRPQMKEIMKQVQSTLKSSFESGVVFTQTHEHILVNKDFAASDFNP